MITLYTAVTLDGFIATKDGGIDFLKILDINPVKIMVTQDLRRHRNRCNGLQYLPTSNKF